MQFAPGDYAEFLTIDFACKVRRIAVKFKGPFHYLRALEGPTSPTSPLENGWARVKRRLMEQMGWKVVNIDYEEMIAAGSTLGARKAYLRSRLVEVDVVNP